MAYDVEFTDTFGGEANYCWVRRYVIPDDKITAKYGTPAYRRQLVAAAKALCGLTGVRCNVTNYGDMIDIRPRGGACVVFVSWRDAPDTTEEEG